MQLSHSLRFWEFGQQGNGRLQQQLVTTANTHYTYIYNIYKYTTHITCNISIRVAVIVTDRSKFTGTWTVSWDGEEEGFSMDTGAEGRHFFTNSQNGGDELYENEKNLRRFFGKRSI